MANTLRPDEIASQSRIKRNQESDENIKRGVKTAIGAAGSAIGVGGAVLGAGIASRIMPFLSQHITPDLAIKGISKISPKVGDFLKKGMSAGLEIKDGLNYLRENLEDKAEQPKQERSKNDRNIIQQYSPELHEFIASEVTKGRSPIEAAAIAQNDKRFAEIIKKLSKDHKTPWSNIAEGIYGNGQYGGVVNPVQQPTQGQSQQPGQGQQAFLAIMQKINQRLGG